MAYVIQFDVLPEQVEKALDSKLHIISLDSSTAASRDDALAALFKNVQEQLDKKAGSALRSSRPDIFEEIRTEISNKPALQAAQPSLIESTSRLCFVMMPFSEKFDEIYRLLIAPAVEKNGLSVVRADEIAAGGSIAEQIRTAILQSRLCIADMTGFNPNVMYEVGFASSNNKAVILLAEEATKIPFDIAHQRILIYGRDLKLARSSLERAIFSALSQDRLKAAITLFDLKQYRSAIATSAIVLEHTLRKVLANQEIYNSARISMGQILQAVAHRRLLPLASIAKLREVMKIRNRAVHEIDEPNAEQAEFVIKTIRDVLDSLPVPQN